MAQAAATYLEGEGKFQDKIASMSEAISFSVAKNGAVMPGSVLALGYHTLRAYYDYHTCEFRNVDAVLPGLAEELLKMETKGYLGSAPDYIQEAADDVVVYFREWEKIHAARTREETAEMRGDVCEHYVLNDYAHDNEYPDAQQIEAALESLMDYAGMMAQEHGAGNKALPNLHKAA